MAELLSMKNAENCIDASLLRKINKVSKDDKILTQDIKLGIKESIIKHLQFDLAREQMSATNKDWLIATCLMARDRIMAKFIRSRKVHYLRNAKRVYYMSLEYLPGRFLKNNLTNLGILDETKKALEAFGQNFEKIAEEELDMGLGNGGLGRLASCFQDSLATLNYSALAYGIHYELGLFRQKIVDGKQIEKPDNWTMYGNPWQICRPEYVQKIKLYGNVEHEYDGSGNLKPKWKNYYTIQGVPWDIPIVGYKSDTINLMRLWEAKSAEEFDLRIFNEGKFYEAIEKQTKDETISKVLYPNDSTEDGKFLRLMQQYFFVSCSIQDILRRFRTKDSTLSKLPEKISIQLNDTHPIIAIAELLRILLDEENMPWDDAWSICQNSFSYTNHTLLPEALEEWPVSIMEKLLPRHYQLICEVNRRFLEGDVERKWPGDDSKKRELSIIHECGNAKVVRMAYLAAVCCKHINGVASMHSELVKNLLFPLFNEIYPEKFTNVTNGVTPRLWIRCCNPELSKLLDRAIGQEWTSDLSKLKELENLADDKAFQEKFLEVKRNNKIRLGQRISQLCRVDVDINSMFDVQIKRLHEYKRQHLNLLHILYLYRRAITGEDITPRTFIFGAKAAPGYYMAKQIIYGINVVANEINNNDKNSKIRVIFLPNYNVSLACEIIPAADLSEQISTAGKEASGTGNMKLAMNGACTICTLDGANVEIKEEVGDENIFVFGKTEAELKAMKCNGYNPHDYYNNDEELKSILDWMGSNYFQTKTGETPLRVIRDNLLDGGDPFFVLADFKDYVRVQNEVSAAFTDKSGWAKKAILNIARSGKFSSDRAINEYATKIWNIDPISIK